MGKPEADGDGCALEVAEDKRAEDKSCEDVSPAAGADGTVRFRVLTAKTQPQNVTGSPTITTVGTYTYYSFTGNGSFGWN